MKETKKKISTIGRLESYSETGIYIAKIGVRIAATATIFVGICSIIADGLARKAKRKRIIEYNKFIEQKTNR